MDWNYVMSQQRLKVVGEERDLGVTLKDDMKVASNCQQAYAKASRMLGMMARTIKFRKPEILIRLYKSLVRPHLEYCVSAWSPHYIKDRELLERVQHRFSRMVPGVEGVGVWWEVGEIGVDDAGRETQPGRSGGAVQDFKRTVCHFIGIFFWAGQLRKNQRSLAQAEEDGMPNGFKKVFLLSEGCESVERSRRGCGVGKNSGRFQGKASGTLRKEDGLLEGLTA